MALVLCTGVDPVLMETRKLILERAGHTIITVRGERELTGGCEKHDCDVAVIGQAISSSVKRTLLALIRQKCPSARILELYPLHQGKALPDADAWLEVPVDVPHDLPERVNQLVKKKKRKRANL